MALIRLFIVFLFAIHAFAFQKLKTIHGHEDAFAPKPSSMIILLGAEVYSPTFLGRKDLILAGSSIIGVVNPLTDQQLAALVSVVATNVYNVSGLKVVPGFIDSHVHLTGGGGELGPQSRTPESKLSELISAGITTAIGVLGTDSVSRSLENLLAKTKAMNNDGLTAHMFTGGYRVPPPLITKSVMEDIVLIQEIIGIGEVAVSDHRSSVPSFDELSRIAADCRVASLLAKKAGIVHVHVGVGAGKLQPLWDIVQKTEVPITQFHPTHLSSRSQELLDDSKNWAKAGGWIDFTAEDTAEANSAIDALLQCKRDGVPLDRVTLSSDAYGSFPVFDDQGQVIGYGVGKADTLLAMLKLLVFKYQWSLEESLSLITSNVATVYQLEKKGKIQEGADGDLIVLDADLNIAYVFGRGKELKIPGWIKKGMFE